MSNHRDEDSISNASSDYLDVVNEESRDINSSSSRDVAETNNKKEESGADTTTSSSPPVVETSSTSIEDSVDEAIRLAKQRGEELAKEAENLRRLETQSAAMLPSTMVSDPEKQETDLRSVYVGNVDYGASPEELQNHFAECGTINRVTILCDKYTGHPKGFAYVEFLEKESVENAVALNDSIFRSRQLKVTPKRTNVPGMTFRGRGRGGFRGGYHPRGGYRPYRGRGRGMYRGGRGYQPYY